MVSWANLPADLVCAIAKRIEQIEEFYVFRAVCSSWRSALPEKPYHNQIKIPWLILPFHAHNKAYSGYYSFFDKKFHPLDLTGIKGKLCRGSSNGWLVMVDVQSPELCLFNPLTKVQITLPPLSTLPGVIKYDPNMHDEEYAVHKESDGGLEYYDKTCFQLEALRKIVVLSSSTDDYLVMAIHQYGLLAFCKPGDKRWSGVSTTEFIFEDAIFHDGKIYALCVSRQLVFGDIGSLPKMEWMKVGLPETEGRRQAYLVGSSTHGLMIVQRFDDCNEKYVPRTKILPYSTTGFKVYKLVQAKKEAHWWSGTSIWDGCKHEWSKIASLDDYVLFLGMNTSFMVSSQNTPQLKGNQIYFTDDNLDAHDVDDGEGGFDFGRFNLKTKTIHKIPGYKSQVRLQRSYGNKAIKQLVWPPPVWMVPN